jgi:hypothetical protein
MSILWVLPSEIAAGSRVKDDNQADGIWSFGGTDNDKNGGGAY